MRAMRHVLAITAVVAIFTSAAVAQGRDRVPKLAGFPSGFVWQNAPVAWKLEKGLLTLTAGKKTDWFSWPGGGYVANSSPRLMFKAAGDFMFSTKVDVNSHVTYDAGCIALYGTESLWAKLCLERQGDGRLDVISVVTHGKSDDATSFPAAGTAIYLKVAKADGAIFFYASEDGKAWTIIRKFNLESKDGLWAGFSAQSPDGDGASASFTDFRYLPGKVNIWKLN